MQPGEYMRLIHCDSPDEVLSKVRAWSSNLDDKEHLIRSTIFEVHAHLETRLKQILYAVFLPLVLRGDDEEKYEAHTKALDKKVQRLSFGSLYGLLSPCFAAFPKDELQDIGRIPVRRQSG